MNSSILELIFHPLFGMGLTIIFGIILLYIMYKDIIEHNKTICPICGKQTKGQKPHYFMRDRKVHRVHQGDCANKFLYKRKPQKINRKGYNKCSICGRKYKMNLSKKDKKEKQHYWPQSQCGAHMVK